MTSTAAIGTATVFFGISGYLSMLSEARILGIPRGALTSNWRYVLEAAEFAAALAVLTIFASIVLLLVVLSWFIVSKAFPSFGARGGVAAGRWLRSSFFAVLLVIMTLAAALVSGQILSSLPIDQAMGELQPTQSSADQAETVFMLAGALLLIWAGLAFAPAGILRENGSQRKWLWYLAAPGLLILAVSLPLSYGAGIRQASFQSVRVAGNSAADASICGLLIERNETRASVWTIRVARGKSLGIVRDVPLAGTTLELGPPLDMREQVSAALGPQGGDRLCQRIAGST